MSKEQNFFGTERRRFRPYPEYKDSGVEWLGNIPSHWEAAPIHSLARSGYKTFTDGDWIESPFIRDNGIRLIQTGNIGVGSYKEQGFRYIDEETSRAFRCTEVTPGDVLICRLADPVGRACLAPDMGVRMITSVDVCILKPANGIYATFVIYALSGKEYLSWMAGICRGGTRDRVSRSMLGSIRIQKPPYKEQRAIAAFLDRETAKIDALIAKKERLIELLQEKRTALITQAVTKGLDPNIPMKDSGVESLGKIPAHWEVKVLKRLAIMRAGTAITSKEIESVGEYPVFGGNGIRGYTGSFTHDGAYPLIGRQGALCGCVNFALGKFWASEHAVVVAPNPSVDAIWLTSLLQAMSLNSYSQSAAQPGLAVDTIGVLRAPLPGIIEQRIIAAFLDCETAKIDSLVIKIKEAIDRLKEYRIALISAAVTGKICVLSETS